MRFVRSYLNRTLALVLAVAALVCTSQSLYAVPFDPDTVTGMTPAGVQGRAKLGWVMARSMVLDENGQPILVEYDDQGNEVSELTVPSQYTSRIGELEVVAASSFLAHIQRMETFTQSNPDVVVRLVRRNQAIGTFPLADNSKQVVISENDLRNSTRSVLIADRPSRLLADPQAVILQEYPFDLTRNPGGVSNARSLLVNEQGQVIATSRYTIAPRAGFYGQDGEVADTAYKYNRESDELYGPVPNVYVYLNEFLYPGGRAVTNDEGYYSFRYNLPVCPPGGFEFNTDVWARIHYANFSPLGQSVLPYYLRRSSSEYCYAAINPVTGMLMQNPASQVSPRTDFYVDVMFLTGRLELANPDGSPVPVGNETRYEVFDPASTDNATPTPWYDFDNDDQADRAVIGRMAENPEDASAEQIFVEDPEGNLQGIYFSSTDAPAGDTPGETPEPDLIRQLDADRQQRLKQSTGLLAAISQEDLQNTDILVFRAATGDLVLERRGLRDEETHRGELQTGEGGGAGYRLMMRGPQDSNLNIGGASGRGTSFEQWATDYQLTEPFRSRSAFHLQPGEWVEIVAINRTTGYTGTARVQLKSAGNESQAGLSVVVDPIKLVPPNLKVWAERDYQIDKGLSAGEKRNGNIISAEGTGLQSDEKIVVYTEWLAPDGSALPEGLAAVGGAQYGLTGRLAKVVSEDTLQAAGFHSEQAEFPIGPGRQTQILQLNDGLSHPEHYYIHVIGKAKNQEACTGGSCADFDYLGSDVGVAAPLDTRPRYVTPILTPHYDEQSHWLAYREYRRLLNAGDDPANGDPATGITPTRPLPTHAWNHRPEYQFSRYSLEMDEINRINKDPATGTETKDNIYNTDTPVIGSSDDLIEVLYSLIGPEFDRLTPIDGGQDLILALGEEETRLTLGEDNTLRFDNLDHLAGLDPEDFLTMRLYLNQDAGNVLWEYAFEHLVLGTQLAEYDPSTGETLYVSADDPRVPLEAMLIGYAGREDKNPIRVRWQADGGATLQTVIDTDQDYGIFTNELTLPPNRGAVSHVSVELLDSAGTDVTLPPVEVKAGRPAAIIVDQADLTVSAAGVDEAALTVTVFDQHGNPVEANTGISFFVEGSLHLVNTSGATDDSGKATLTLKGGDVAEAANVRITAGDVTTNVPVTVKPLSIEFLGLDSTLFASATDSFTLRVTDYQGKPVPDASITLGSSYGFLSQTEVVTDAAGEVTASITAPDSAGNGQLTAQIGRSAWHKTPFEVVYPQLEHRDLEVNNAMMVGDTAAPGTLNHVRYDTSLISLPYKVSETIRALGAPGDSVTVTIGDFRDPNLAPIAAY